MKQNLKTAGKWILFLLPFIIGTIGFLTTFHDGLLNAAYRAIRLYIIELDSEYSEINLLVEIARWMAPVMTAAAVIALIGRFWTAILYRLRIRNHNAIAIHGNSEAAAYLQEHLGNRAVSGDSRISMSASRHILSFRSDQEALEYLSSSREQLFRNNHKVYLCVNTVSRSNYVNRNLVFCNFAEICARNYWREYPLKYFSGERRIAVIGFGNYGRQLLDQALLTNVYSSFGGIRYDIYGSSETYLGLHPQLEQIAAVNRADMEQEKRAAVNRTDMEQDQRAAVNQADIRRDQTAAIRQTDMQRDQIWFYPDWRQAIAQLEQADRVIIIDDHESDNLLTLSEISQYAAVKQVYCRVHNESLIRDLGNGAIAFGTDRELYTEGCIIDEETLQDARRIHAAYYRDYRCRKTDACSNMQNCLTCSDMMNDWYGQSSFLIGSNIAQADHIPVKMQILLKRDDFHDLPDAQGKARAALDEADAHEKNRLSEIEHLRWNRYHYLNNWKYGPNRCNEQRIHPDLVPYSELGAEAAKDLSAWESALLLFGNH